MIRVTDVAFVRFSAPDLDRMEVFLTDFGLVRSVRTEDKLFVRGTDPEPYLHITQRGEAVFRGVAFEAASAEDLVAASKLVGASPVEKLDEPGGGQRVRFTDPDGYAVEVVHGREPLEPLPVRKALPYNRGSDRQRFGALQRFEKGPAQVKRLGHVVLRVKDFRASEAWYKSRFGFLSSDEIYLGDEQNVITAFMRCDRGDTYVDHHTFLCVGIGEPGFEHAAFEVEDMDAVMVGHDRLREAGWEHAMGIGRHVLGGQIFDYWRDPWGRTLEHFTDGDLLNASAKSTRNDPATALGNQWGKFGN